MVAYAGWRAFSDYRVMNMNGKFLSTVVTGIQDVSRLRLPLLIAATLVLGACSSRAALEAEQAAAEQTRVAAEQEAARVAAEEARMRAEAQERERQARLEEQRRQEAERQRQVEVARQEAEARAAAERRQREEAERREAQRRQEQQAVARAQAEREEKLARIAELEAQIAAMEANVAATENANSRYREAIAVAEELMGVLTAEQSKYENLDENGNPVEPLAKDLIADLESRKDTLVRQAETTPR